MIFYYGPLHGHENILIYITICSLIGSLSVMGCKGIGVALSETFSGNNEFTNWLTWFFVFAVVACISVQMNYLNRALDIFNTSVVTPIYYVFFTTFTIVASAILFKEWRNLGAKDIIGNLCGFLTIISAIFLLHFFKDLNLSLADLRRLVHANEPGSTGNGELTALFQRRARKDESTIVLLQNRQDDSEEEVTNTRESKSIIRDD